MSYIRRRERFGVPPTACDDCRPICCPGLNESFGNVRRPRRVVRRRRENFGKNCSDIHDEDECNNNGNMHNPSCCWSNGKCEVGGMPWGCS